jgi:hypothetical protein
MQLLSDLKKDYNLLKLRLINDGYSRYNSEPENCSGVNDRDRFVACQSAVPEAHQHREELKLLSFF